MQPLAPFFIFSRMSDRGHEPLEEGGWSAISAMPGGRRPSSRSINSNLAPTK
jgi:hypothetical protein